MLKIGAVELTDAPRVAVGFSDKQSTKVIGTAIEKGLDLAEVRIDLFSMFDRSHVKAKLAAFSKLATIGTIRSQVEGGKWTGTEAQRFDLFQLITNIVDSVDVELSSTGLLGDVAGLCASAQKTLIVSHHDFDKTPSLMELNDIVDRCKAARADVVKISTMITSEADIQTLAHLMVSRKSENLVVIGMGSLGLISRLMFPALGSLMTYAYIGEPTAPGQLHFDDLVADLRRYYPAYNQRLIVDLKLMEHV